MTESLKPGGSWRQLGLIVAMVVAVSAVLNHGVAAWVGIDTRVKVGGMIGTNYSGRPAMFAGSSMIGAAIDWEQVAKDLGRPIRGVTLPSASPCELEVLTREVKDADPIFVSVSIYDMDENYLSDFRADVVPIDKATADLLAARAGWPFLKRNLSRYPLSLTRKLFPTAGRSMGIMVGLRAKAHGLLHHGDGGGDDERLAVNGETVPTNRVTDWPAGRLMRNISVMRSDCGNKHDFGGVKSIALRRMLARLVKQGKVLVVVLPVSPAYQLNFLTDAQRGAFEGALSGAQQAAPQAGWLRLDRVPQFQTNDVFADLIHLNREGRLIATAAFRERIKSLGGAP